MRPILAFTLLVVALSSNATLIDRGGGLLYDTVLDVTWLQDANYAQSSGFDSDGKMGSVQAEAWVGDLVYFDETRGQLIDNWRLPTYLEPDLPFHYGWWVSGGGIDPTPTVGPHTELSYMFYYNLGLNGYHNTNGAWANDFGIHGNSSFGSFADVGLVKNIQGGEYWLDFNMADLTRHYDTQPFTFNMITGNHYVRTGFQFVWAVRDGDVQSVSEPQLFGLLVVGLLGIGFTQIKRLRL